MRIIFLLSAPRSGTTLLANVIANHSEVCSVDSETNIFSWRTCFYSLEGKARWNSQDFNKLRKQHGNVIELLDEISKQYKADNNSTRFLEKTPQHVFHLGYILKHYTNAKIVNIMRDPRDAYLSSKANDSVIQKSTKEYARYWRRSVLASQKHVNAPGMIECRYEDITNEPVSELTRIMTELGLDFEENQIKPSKMGHDPRAFTDQFRLLGKQISNERNGLFASELSTNEIRQIESVVGDVLSIHDYKLHTN